MSKDLGLDLNYFKELVKDRSSLNYRENAKILDYVDSITSGEIEEFYLQYINPENGAEFEPHYCLYFFYEDTCLIAKYHNGKYYYTSFQRKTVKKELVHGTYNANPELKLFFSNGEDVIFSLNDSPNKNWEREYAEHLIYLYKVI